jgi:hypothetical protein
MNFFKNHVLGIFILSVTASLVAALIYTWLQMGIASALRASAVSEVRPVDHSNSIHAQTVRNTPSDMSASYSHDTSSPQYHPPQSTTLQKALPGTEPEHAMQRAPVSPPEASSGNNEAPVGPVSGVPVVADTATYVFNDRRIHLYGLVGATGIVVSEVSEFIQSHGGSVTCTLYQSEAYLCETASGDDMAHTSLINGWAFASTDAPQDYIASQQLAELDQIGVWK